MTVKRSQSAARVLTVLEAVAERQPIGVSALARELDIDKSAAQRALMTLADDGWIQPAPGTQALWELSSRVLALAHPPHSIDNLRRRARPVLERIREETGETVFLIVPDHRRFIVVDALESRHMLRMVPPVGMIVQVRQSASGRAILPFMTPAQQADMLGEAPDEELLGEYAETRARGFSISDGRIDPSMVTIAAPLFARGAPVGAVVLSGPRDRMAGRHDTIGAMLMAAAAELSQDRA